MLMMEPSSWARRGVNEYVSRLARMRSATVARNAGGQVDERAGHATVAERIRASVETCSITLVGGQVLGCAISIGGAYAPQWVRSTPSVWMERADLQLYRAKSEGRNRTCLEPTPVSVVSAEEKGLLFA